VALKLADKQQIVTQVKGVAEQSLSAVIADYQGLAVSDMTALRNQARQDGVYLQVVRNTLARRAVAGTEFECLDKSLVGPTVLAFAKEDPGAAARLLKAFAKENDKLKIKALAVDGRLLPAEQIDVLAKLPTREQALATLLSVMQAPVGKLARTLNEVPGKFVRVLAAVRDNQPAAG
jgi:large subunit ribosomal protein L10